MSVAARPVPAQVPAPRPVGQEFGVGSPAAPHGTARDETVGPIVGTASEPARLGAVALVVRPRPGPAERLPPFGRMVPTCVSRPISISSATPHASQFVRPTSRRASVPPGVTA